MQGYVHSGPNGKALSRANGNMQAMTQVIFEIECGDTVEEDSEKLEARGLGGAIYPTFSDMRTTTLIAKSNLKGDDIQAAAADYLRTLKRWRQRMLDTITSAEIRRTEEKNPKSGKVKIIEHVVVSHAPLSCHRVVLPLSREFDLGSGEERAKREAEWQAAYLAVADELGFCIDVCGVKLSQPMYLPRRPAGSAERGAIGVMGRALDLSEFKRKPEQTISQRAVAALPPRTAEPWEPKTIGLLRFLHDHGHDFDVVKFILEGRPDDKVRRNKKRQHVVRCPNEASHTERDLQHLKNDTACVCDNARPKNGWILLCQHSGCGFDRAKLLDVECQNRGIKDASELLAWCRCRSGSCWNSAAWPPVG